MELHTVSVQILHVLIVAAPLLAQFHNVAHILLGRNNAGLNEGLLGLLNLRRVRIVQRRVDLQLFTVGFGDVIDDVGGRSDQIEIILPFQPLHNDLHVEQPQEAAAKTEAQRDGSFPGQSSWKRR